MRSDFYLVLRGNIAPLRSALLDHPIYKEVVDAASLRTFMEAHVFAVWDFMTLVKTLQRDLTCIRTPWVPPQDPNSARFINEIVLTEESDRVGENLCMSHFDLYLKAMVEVGADVTAVSRFVELMRSDVQVMLAAEQIGIPSPSIKFISSTLRLASASPHEVASAFLFGREDVIPAMFRKFLEAVEERLEGGCSYFRLYLERHIHLDETEHVPLGEKLLHSLCGEDSSKWNAAQCAAERALEARICLWDELRTAIQEEKTAHYSRGYSTGDPILSSARRETAARSVD